MVANNSGKFQTKNENLLKILALVSEMANSNEAVLILGESGSGRRLLAQEIHEKKNGLAVESSTKLVRYSKFISGRSFLGETLLIEDLQTLDIYEQENLMEIILEHKNSIKIIATASENFFDLVSRGFVNRGIKDCFKWTLRIPPLAERREDIPLLATHILQTYSWIAGRVFQLSNSALETLLRYSWPGNISELERILEKAVTQAEGAIINAIDLDLQPTVDFRIGQVATLAEMEKKLIIQTLQVTQNNKSQAARLLGISIRTLRNKLSQYKEEGHYESDVR